ncbi:MAG: hypothetical protein ACK559_09475, partial [bacterium]
ACQHGFDRIGLPLQLGFDPRLHLSAYSGTVRPDDRSRVQYTAHAESDRVVDVGAYAFSVTEGVALHQDRVDPEAAGNDG